MFQKIKNNFKKNPTIYYAMSIAASWAGVGSLMNSITMTQTYGIVPSLIWSLCNSLACILFGLIVCKLPTLQSLMRTKAMKYVIGIMSVFQLWINMNGIQQIFADTIIGETGGTILVYAVCIGFIIALVRFGMIRNVLTDHASWCIVYMLVLGVTIAAVIHSHGAYNTMCWGVDGTNMQIGIEKGFLLLPGPFTYPYFYRLLDYNENNSDGTSRGNIKKSFILGGLMFGIYMVFTFALAFIHFSPALTLISAILVSIVGISTLSTFLYSEYIVFGRKGGLCINCSAVLLWPVLMSLGVMGVWTLMAEIRIYLIAVLFIIALAKKVIGRKEMQR